jgi:hypothetical protein
MLLAKLTNRAEQKGGILHGHEKPCSLPTMLDMAQEHSMKCNATITIDDISGMKAR